MATQIDILGSVQAGIEGQPRPEYDNEYRAVLVRCDEVKPVLRVEQRIGGHWHPTGGSWYLSTLWGEGNPNDSIYIDFGQKWLVSSGMRAAIDKALGLVLEAA